MFDLKDIADNVISWKNRIITISSIEKKDKKLKTIHKLAKDMGECSKKLKKIKESDL